MARKTIHSTGGFWLILGALLLAASLRLLFWAAVAAAVHELGHVAAVRALGGRVGSFRLTGVGAVIQPRRERMFSYGEECLVALAGPAASVLLAIGAATWGRHFGGADAYLLTGVSLALGVFNLLPIGPLDGGRILRAVASRWAGPDAGDRVCGLLTKVLYGCWGRAEILPFCSAPVGCCGGGKGAGERTGAIWILFGNGWLPVSFGGRPKAIRFHQRVFSIR